jgi:hypothetical protein
MNKLSLERTVTQKTIQIWADFIRSIPYLQQSRANCPNVAVRRGINSVILQSSFSLVEGFLWNFIESSIYRIQIDSLQHEIFTRILNDYLDNKDQRWDFKTRIKLCEILTTVDVKNLKSYGSVSNLQKIRNVTAHGGEVSVVLDDLKSGYFKFKEHRGKLIDILIEPGFVKQQDKDKFLEEDSDRLLNLIFSDDVADFYFQKVKEFLADLNSYQLNEAYKKHLDEHVIKFD